MSQPKLIHEPDSPEAPAACLLCSKQFPAPVRFYQSDGVTVSHQGKQFALKVSAHLQQAHPEIVAENVAILSMLDSFLVCSRFTLPGALAKVTDINRSQLHNYTRLIRVSDEKLVEKVMSLNLISARDQAAVLGMLTELRNLYEERGLHPEIEEARKRQEAAAAGESSNVES